MVALVNFWRYWVSFIGGTSQKFVTPVNIIHYLSYLHCCLTDQELRNVIDKLAQFVARNGPEFEKMTMEKQKDNPKFSFLFGGEFFGYYKYKLAIEQQQRK